VGGLIFGCNNETHDECMSRRLLGLPGHQLKRLHKIRPYETALFLYNYSSRKLFGVFEATAAPGLNLEPDAWRSAAQASNRLDVLARNNASRRTGAESGGSPFPAQVRFQVVHEFKPLDERRYKHIVTYNRPGSFEFVLTEAQVEQLMAAFTQG